MDSYATKRPMAVGEESIPSGEQESIKRLVDLQTKVMKPHLRGQHPKAHGCVEAEFFVLAEIPVEFRVGIFEYPNSYKAIVRFSNGKSANDAAPDAHGMAIKVFGVAGRKALPEDNSDIQDFILIDNETFFARDVETMLDFMTARVMEANDPDAMKKYAAASQHNRETVVQAQKMLKANVPSPLAIRYWSTVPYQFGYSAMKFSVRPVDSNQVAMPNDPSENYLRQALVEHLTKHGKCAAFDFFVQLQTDPEKMPIEDPTVSWSSPEIRVATLHIAPQVFDTPDRNTICENSIFSPWHALEVHRPLGGIGRARKAVYEASAKLRRKMDG